MNLVADQYGQGVPVVLIHGQPGSARDWDQVVPLLEKNHRVVVPDRPGYGRTAGKPLGFAGNAAAIVSLLDRMGIGRAVLVGHSWGGGVALAAAARHPERVAALVLVASVCPAEPPGWLDRLLAAPALGELVSAATIGSAGLVLRNRRVRAALEGRLDGKASATLLALEALTGARTGTPVWRSFVFEQRRLFDELGRLEPLLGTIGVPTVVVTGDADRIVGVAAGECLATSLPSAVHRVVPGANHLLQLEHPEEVVQAIREVSSGQAVAG